MSQGTPFCSSAVPSISIPLVKTTVVPDQQTAMVHRGMGADGGQSKELPDTAQEEDWTVLVHNICAAQLRPEDPCLEFLRGRGFDLGGMGGVRRFAGEPSPMGGKRWYLPVGVRGRSAQLLIDTGASHSLIGREFYQSLAAESDVPLGTGQVTAADGSEMQT